ncbi:MAG: transposase [Halioglobus sp.]|nr:transposase [Halioglobus sp.]
MAEQIRGKPPDDRQQVRQARAGPVLNRLHNWLQTTLTQVSRKSELAGAIRYALGRWPALLRYCADGQLEIDNNTAERALRCVALGRLEVAVNRWYDEEIYVDELNNGPHYSIWSFGQVVLTVRLLCRSAH